MFKTENPVKLPANQEQVLHAEGKGEPSRTPMQKLINQSPVVICTVDKEGRFVQVNDSVWDIWGYRPEELVHQEMKKFLHPNYVAATDEHKALAVKGKEIREFQNCILSADGKEVFMEWSARWDPTDELIYSVGVDVTALKKAEAEKKEAHDQIKKAKDQYEMVLGATRAIVYDWNVKKRRISWGNNFETFSTGDHTTEEWMKQIHPDDRDRVEKELRNTLASPTAVKWEQEYRALKEDGTYGVLVDRATILRDGNGAPKRMVGSIEDITVQRQKEVELQKSLEEKEMLLSEVHHRVKNNLAIISGLLQLEAFEEQNADIKARLMEFVTRIHSIANVHEHLYKSSSFSKLDFSESLRALVKKVIDTVQTETQVVPEFDMDPVELNINQAMPLSMIVNELLNFILKHSLQGLEKGAIKAELRVKGEAVNLRVTDNGKGLAETFKAGEEKPLGMQLIDQLSKQLKGNYSCEATNAGSEYNFAFKKADRKGTGNARL